jgi:hypothetical protein
MVLRLVSEEMSWTNDGGGSPEAQTSRREMLSAMMATLTPVLSFLCSTLESKFSQAVHALESGDQQAAKQNAATVSAALGDLLNTLRRLAFLPNQALLYVLSQPCLK